MRGRRPRACANMGAVGDGRVRTWGPSASMQSALATTHLLQPSARKTLRALNRGKICALCIPERRFEALFGYMARISCQCQFILDTWRRCLAREGRFSRPRPLRGCMKRKTCHGWPPGNASRRYSATARRSGMRSVDISPRPGARNSFREHLAIAELPRAHRRHTLPWRRSLGQHIADMSCHAWPLRTNRACISLAKPPFGCAGCSMLAPTSPGAGLLQI